MLEKLTSPPTALELTRKVNQLVEELARMEEAVASASSQIALKAPIASPTFTGFAKATGNTSYSTAQLRNIYAGTADMTAGTTTLENGCVYLVYE